MADKRNPSYLEVQPADEVPFNYIPKKYLVSSLRLTNITDYNVAFKIKTNVPVSYLVKPHTGSIAPGKTIDVSITMQPTDYNPQNAAIKDKFLINAFPVLNESDLGNIAALWDQISSSQIQSIKLKVGLKYDVMGSSQQLTSKPSQEDLSNPSKLTRSETLYEQPKETMLKSFTGSATNITPATNEYSTPMQKSNLINQGQKVESDEDKSLVERINFYEKRNQELLNDLDSMNKQNQELISKREEQERLLMQLAEEKNRLKSELDNVKRSTFKAQPAASDPINSGVYQLWHLIMVAIIALVLGAFLSS